MKCLNLRYAYEAENDVLKGITTEIREGEVVYIVGPSGCGKTTLAKIAAKIIEVRTGSVEFPNGRAVWFVPQFPENLFLFDTVEEEIRATKDDAREVYTRYVLREFGFDYEMIAGMSPRRMSFGQRRLFAIALQAQIGPSLLILDEPSLGLDDNNMHTLSSWISTRISEQHAVFIVTHDLELIRQLEGSLIVLNNGQIGWRGRSIDFLDSRELQELAAAI